MLLQYGLLIPIRQGIELANCLFYKRVRRYQNLVSLKIFLVSQHSSIKKLVKFKRKMLTNFWRGHNFIVNKKQAEKIMDHWVGHLLFAGSCLNTRDGACKMGEKL